jgi:hypothetical protein
VINDVILFGEPRDINNYSPIVTVEFSDKDTVTRDDFLGVTRAQPVVCLDGKYPKSPNLQWFPIRRMGKIEGEVLAAFVLFLAVSEFIVFTNGGGCACTLHCMLEACDVIDHIHLIPSLLLGRCETP